MGRRYERVFPVPVGETAARSRPYIDKKSGTTATEVVATHLEKDGNRV